MCTSKYNETGEFFTETLEEMLMHPPVESADWNQSYVCTVIMKQSAGG